MTGQVIAGQASPASSGDRLAFIRSFPRELHDGRTVALSDAIVDGGADGDELKFAKAVTAESYVGGHYHVQIFTGPYLARDYPPLPEEWVPISGHRAFPLFFALGPSNENWAELSNIANMAAVAA